MQSGKHSATCVALGRVVDVRTPWRHGLVYLRCMLLESMCVVPAIVSHRLAVCLCVSACLAAASHQPPDSRPLHPKP